MQMTNNISSANIIILVWFAFSVLVVIVGTIAFWIWLRRLGVKLIFGLINTPGYLEYAYIKWCRNHQQIPSKKIILLRIISIVNVIIAGIFFILMITG